MNFFLFFSADEEKDVVQRIKHLFAKIEEMRKQRLDLYQKLRDQVMADDITKTIVTRASDEREVGINTNVALRLTNQIIYQ